MEVQRNDSLIPQAAVTEQQGSYLVDVVGSDKRVEVRQVKVGERTGTMWVIQRGLKAGECVVVQGQHAFADGPFYDLAAPDNAKIGWVAG